MLPEIEERHADIDELCRRYSVRRLDLFGSAANDGFREPDSDLDFLVEFDSREVEGYADRYFGLKHALEDLFERPVDLVVDSAIRNPYFREEVDETRVSVYAA